MIACLSDESIRNWQALDNDCAAMVVTAKSVVLTWGFEWFGGIHV